jgi:multidrug efflux pump subunit AcrA (membrane-fusion protein)
MTPESTRSMRGRVTRIVGVTVVALVSLVAVGFAPRLSRHDELAAAARPANVSVPSVTVMVPPRASRVTDLVLPGTIQAIQETAIYARVDGYLKSRLVDIGDRVQSGQVLAEIDAPELDQQLSQAKATLTQAEATLAQARSSLLQARATLQHNQAQLGYHLTTLSRWRTLKDKELVAQQDVDDRQILADSDQADVDAAQANVDALHASVAAADANVTASRANVQRLVDTQSFQKVRAPFPGIITVRNVDTGALISAGSVTGNTPLFRMAQIDDLRIYVNVPQTFVTAIAPGLGAQLVVREFPQRVFSARVVSTAGARAPQLSCPVHDGGATQDPARG